MPAAMVAGVSKKVRIMRDEERFGAFLRKKREERSVTMRALSKELGFSAAYLSDVEHGRRYPLSPEKIRKTARILSCNKEETNQMFDLAAISRGTITQDILDYIKERDYVVRALRIARDLDASEVDWLSFINRLESKDLIAGKGEK